MILSNLSTISIDEERCRDQSNSDKAKRAIAPAQTHSFVHFRTGKRQEGTEETSRYRQGCDSRGGEFGEGINGVGLNWNEDAHHAETEWDESDDWDNPLKRVISVGSDP